MNVKAIDRGYGGVGTHSIRELGDIFDMPEGAKGSWFVPLDSEDTFKPKVSKRLVKDEDALY